MPKVLLIDFKGLKVRENIGVGYSIHVRVHTCMYIPILLQSSPSMVSGLAEGALVKLLIINTSADISLILSMGHG